MPDADKVWDFDLNNPSTPKDVAPRSRKKCIGSV